MSWASRWVLMRPPDFEIEPDIKAGVSSDNGNLWILKSSYPYPASIGMKPDKARAFAQWILRTYGED